MKDEKIADLTLLVAEDMASAAMNAGEALEFIRQIAGWSEQDIRDWMGQNDICAACIGNFEDNGSLYSPNDCFCNE